VNAFDFVRCDPDDPDEDATAVAGGKKKGNPFVACLQLMHADAMAITMGSPGSWERSSYRMQPRSSTALTVHNYASAVSR